MPKSVFSLKIALQITKLPLRYTAGRQLKNQLLNEIRGVFGGCFPLNAKFCTIQSIV